MAADQKSSPQQRRGLAQRAGKIRNQKFYLLTDLEGPAGVSLWSQTREPSNVNKLFAMNLLTEEVNAAVAGILDVHPRAEVHVLDGHGAMGINAGRLHPWAKLWLGQFPDRLAGLDSSYRAVLFVGQHAMAGTPDAPLCHTYSSREVESYQLNGEKIGEFGCRTLLAASVGVPVIFLSGDDKAVAEAKAFLPSLETVTTKTGGGVQWALHLSPTESRALIRRGVRKAVKALARGRSSPLPERKAPYELVVTLLPGAQVEALVKRGGRRVGRNKVVFRSKSLLDLPI
ncbi:MAG: M55 family metallopeptidase [Verrucomicrobiia bacterium]